MRIKSWLLCLMPGLIFFQSQAQRRFSHAEQLRGKLTSLRTCFDVLHYDITVRVDPDSKFISGSNIITFRVVNDMQKMQIDLADTLTVNTMMLAGQPVVFTRDSGALILDLGRKLKKGSIRELIVGWSGHPRAARKAPWDGGFVWAKDSSGRDWIGLACEGAGASTWLPCKDHLSDEPDSMDMHLEVPSDLTGVSNGRLVGSTRLSDGFTRFDWSVKSPINPYNISITAGDFVHLHDEHVLNDGSRVEKLDLDYYVLRGNEGKAKGHFGQVHQMLDVFTMRFGIYPFVKDGYKLVETPYWGMEHQSAIAYGNHYRNNKWGFDFIIVHESGHEWFGNSISCKDPADMWIHESFTTYSEALFVEATMSYRASIRYLQEQRLLIGNKEPMIGVYDVAYHGRADNDIYYKGTWMLHTLRSMMDNDTAWFRVLKEMNRKFYRQNVTTADITGFLAQATGLKLEGFFKQYLHTTEIPLLEYKIKEKDHGLEVRYRWANTVGGFEMPVKITVTKGNFDFVTPTKSWQLIDLNFFNKDDFKMQTERFLFDVKKVE
jgi:aminopeptidase N